MSVVNQNYDDVLQKLSVIQQTYEELNLHEDLLSLLLTRTNEMFLLVDEDGMIRAVNPACQNLVGYSSDQLIGQSLVARVHPDDGEQAFFHFSMIKLEISSKPIEFRFQHSDGFYVWLEANFKMISHQTHQDAIMIQLREITDRKLMEDQVLLKEKVFENALEGIVITDLDGRILMVNPAFTSITGYQREEVLGHNPRMLKSDFHPKEYFTELWNQLKQNGKWEGEIWNKRKTGEIFVEWATIRLIRNEQGKKMYYASVFTDITKRKEEQAKLWDDLQLAKQVQKNVLSDPIHNQHVEIDALYLPSETLGGDMYAWYEIDEHRFGVILMDVVGHGVAASLISMSIRSLLGGLITRLVCPELVMKELNRHMRNLYHKGKYSADQFFTAIYLLIDTKNQVIEYCNAGHPSGILLTSRDQISLLDQGSVPIGLFQKLPISKYQVPYFDQSRILLYTDGIIESNHASFTWTSKNLQRSLLKHSQLSNREYIDILKTQIELSLLHEDDICVVSITIPK